MNTKNIPAIVTLAAGLIAMIVMIAVLFMACFYFFTRYDVR